MSIHRTIILAIAALFSLGMTSIASAGCCGAPVVCCGVVYAQPIVHVRHVHKHHMHKHWAHRHAPVVYTALGCGCGPGRGLFNTYFAQNTAATTTAPTTTTTVDGGHHHHHHHHHGVTQVHKHAKTPPTTPTPPTKPKPHKEHKHG
jgi:hypothetical protein